MVNSTLTLNDITLQNGDVQDDWGGAIYSMSASITLDNTRFINNRSDNGGAIYFTLGRIEITDSEFLTHSARIVLSRVGIWSRCIGQVVSVQPHGRSSTFQGRD